MEYLYGKLILLDSNITNQLSFVNEINKCYGINMIIFNDASEKEIIGDSDDHYIKIVGTGLLEKHFDLKTLFGGEHYHIHKLIIIYKLDNKLLSSKFIKYLISYGNQFNISTLILNYDIDIIKNVIKMCDVILFDCLSKNNTRETYDKYFIKYPPFDLFENTISRISDNEILIYLKNTPRYVESKERFKTMEIENTNNNKVNYDVDVVQDFIIKIEI